MEILKVWHHSPGPTTSRDLKHLFALSAAFTLGHGRHKIALFETEHIKEFPTCAD